MKEIGKIGLLEGKHSELVGFIFQTMKGLKMSTP
jgi:hypothetical protein